MSFLDKLMPHGMCYAWRPDILWLHVFSDLAITLAYFSIPIALFHFLRKRIDAPFRGVVFMFSIFILACGLTHMMSIIVVWNGYYGIQGVLKVITALASVGTAVMLYPVIPKLLALRSPVELEASNDALQQEIEQRQRSEMQSLEFQRELTRIGRITTMGQMATGLAHELNQPLLAISQSADTALINVREKAVEDQELLDCIEDIQAQTLRAGEIIRALRQFISKDTTNRSDLDLNELIRQSIQLTRPEAHKHSIVLEDNLGNIPVPNADRVQIAQVLVNLLRNSIDAIASSNSQHRKISVESHRENENIRISVEDTGPGITQGVEPFKAFESSKSDGMGIGLSISRSIIESHGGKLWFERIAGSSTRFTFTLPLLEK